MTRQETAQILAGVRLLWPHSNLGQPSDATAAWHRLLERFTAQDVELAVRELAATGREHAPPPGVVLRTVADRATDLPTWEDAWDEIDRLISRWGGYRIPPPDEFSHPLIAAFARPSWQQLCVGPATGTKEFGTHYAQQREAFKAMRYRVERGAALDAVGAARRRPLPRPFTAALASWSERAQLEVGNDEAGATA